MPSVLLTLYGEEPKYENVPGFCGSGNIEEIREYNYVLTPGRYVEAETAPEKGKPFEEKMSRPVAQLRERQAEERSDIDFLVEMEPGRSLPDQGGLRYELEKLLGTRVDMAIERGLKARIREQAVQGLSS